MRRRTAERTQAVAGPLAAILAVVLVAPPCAQAEMATVRMPIAMAARTHVDAAVLALQAAPAATTPSGKSFFKTRKGAIAAALMVGGLVWAAVSRSKDSIHSPARK
jgi:hypothetical protein